MPGFALSHLMPRTTVPHSAAVLRRWLVIDAKDEGAAVFYRHHGFIPLPNLPLTLFLPLATELFGYAIRLMYDV